MPCNSEPANNGLDNARTRVKLRSNEPMCDNTQDRELQPVERMRVSANQPVSPFVAALCRSFPDTQNLLRGILTPALILALAASCSTVQRGESPVQRDESTVQRDESPVQRDESTVQRGGTERAAPSAASSSPIRPAGASNQTL